MSEADDLWLAFQRDPVGTYEAIGQQLQGAGYATQQSLPPDYEEVKSWYQAQKAAQLEADELDLYDRTLDALLAQPANADIDRNLLHGFIAAAEGDYERGIAIYRHNERAMQERAREQLGITAERQVAASSDPRDTLHRAIEQAAAAARRR